MFSALGKMVDAKIVSKSGMYELIHFEGTEGSMFKMFSYSFGSTEFTFNKRVDGKKLAKIISYFKFVAGVDRCVSPQKLANFRKIMSKVV